MTELHDVELRGCTPEPLMSYLKALGIFRLVAEQTDPQARAWWRNDTFFLRSKLDREALKAFFLDEYRPTPIVSPWNGGGGFYPTSNSQSKEAVGAIQSEDSCRLNEYRQVIDMSRRVLNDMSIVKKPSDAEKKMILAKCRSLVSDASIPWLDTVYVLAGEDVTFAPILGTGANDGNLDFAVTFMRNLIPSLTGVGIGKKPSKRTNPDDIRNGWLNISLFDQGNTPLHKGAVGQFNPGGVGAVNGTVGFQASPLSNPWDYVLMIEGALLFASAAARKLTSSRSKAVVPFTVDTSAAGYGTSSDVEYGRAARAEFWAPLWDRPSNLSELSHLATEGRAQLGRRQASTGTDFARAIAGLGAERGISQFQRYTFFARFGRMYLAVPLGRFHIRRDDKETAERANVLFDLDNWTESFRRDARGSRPPQGVGSALRRIDDAIIEFCQRGQPRDLQNVLITVGHAERWLSKSSIRDSVHPLNSLSWDWLKHADDDTPEFRLARSLASILPEPANGERKVGPIRENLEPVKFHLRTEWNKGSTSFAWRAGDPLASLMAVLERRCLEGKMMGLDYPPIDAAYSPRLTDIVDFLNDDVDYQRIADLALPLSFIRYRQRQSDGNSGQRSQFNIPFGLPAAYAAMKLTLLPRKFKCPEFGVDTDIWSESRMLALLRAGRVKDAYNVAYRRLKASGLQPLSDDPGVPDRSDYGRRLAAALLFPLDETANNALAQRALRQPETESK